MSEGSTCNRGEKNLDNTVGDKTAAAAATSTSFSSFCAAAPTVLY